MDDFLQIELYKKLLLKEVSTFCRKSRAPRKNPGDFLHAISLSLTKPDASSNNGSIRSVIDSLKEKKWNAVFFGGMLRSLLISKLDPSISRRPRDIDIVIEGAETEELGELFESEITRRTRFGGFQLRRTQWQYDVWPLNETHALLEDAVKCPTFDDLPKTTFFNVEAVAVDVWPRRGLPRKIYSGDDQFFRSIMNRTIEINREQNPYPDLCVVRSLVMAANLNWKVGPRLLSYLGRHGRNMSAGDFEAIQQKHYGRLQWAGKIFTESMKAVDEALANMRNEPVELPLPKQLTLWSEDEIYREQVNLRVLKATTRKQRH